MNFISIKKAKVETTKMSHQLISVVQTYHGWWNCYKLIVVIFAQLFGYTKNHWIVCFKCEFYGTLIDTSINLQNTMNERMNSLVWMTRKAYQLFQALWGNIFRNPDQNNSDYEGILIYLQCHFSRFCNILLSQIFLIWKFKIYLKHFLREDPKIV